MRHEKISIKWKIYLYLLAFMGVLLVVLWLIQICYLDTFYKMIKTNEAETLISEITTVLKSDSANIGEQIDALAAQSNMTVFVAGREGDAVYSAEYITTSRLETMPAEMVKAFYEKAKENGGSAKIEFEGELNKTFLEEAMPQLGIAGSDPMEEGAAGNDSMENGEAAGKNPMESEDASGNAPMEDGAAGGKNPMEDGNGDINGNGPMEDGNGDAADPRNQEPEHGTAGFLQNLGQDRMESVIYVNIVELDGEELVLMVNAQLTPVDATVNTLRIELVCITVIMLVLSLGIALLMSRQVSKSLIRINESAKELAGGNFDIRFEGKDYREVAELSDTLNVMASELDKNERLRRELIANVSHDLRTPLTMIIAYAEVMRDLPGENTPENVQVVIDEAQRLTNLVNDMLDISKLQAGVLEKRATVYNLTESIESVFERYNKLKEQDGYTISFSYDRMVMVEADEYKIFQVIYNLVNNAINYTGEDKQIWVRQKVKDDCVRIEISDSGDGIAPEALPYVWDRYYKVDKTHKRAVMGTGLGLSIVKNILELHGAAYGVESRVGEGSTFWFELKAVGTIG